MSNSLVYQGYAARIEFSSENECFIGHIAGIKDVVGFHGETVSELKAAFEEAVNNIKQPEFGGQNEEAPF